ncbi:hypothetical protein AYK21_00260 [Thermoplasmatales archaeon SG8-52-2]|nr:MAG: hypothetical protein AYK21_00260 [Thermoplasmatales archaeon SG8-52-2]
MKIRSIFLFGISLLLVINSLSVAAIENRDFETKKSGTTFEDDVIYMINQIDEDLVYDYLEKLVSFGPRYTGTDNCKQAGDYIFSVFENLNLDTEFHEWKFRRFKSRNVVGTLKGYDTSSDAIIIISAHYDTVKDSPGANDDGSGVAAVLAIAELLSNYSLRHDVCFIAFSGEEVGTYGSYLYAKEAYESKENIYAVLNVDIIGGAQNEYGGGIIRFSHMERSSWIVEFSSNISHKYSDLIELRIEDIPNYRGADNQAFVDYGYDGVWIAEHDPGIGVHSPNDNLTNVNLTYLAKVTKLMLAVLAEMANKPIDVQVIIKTPYEGRGYFFNRSIIPLGLGKLYFWGLRGTTLLFGRRVVASCEVISEEDIKFVIFCIDDEFIFWDNTPPYEWKIQGKYIPLLGRHKLQVYAYTYSGKRATDEMDIIAFTLSSQYGRF